jgi:hypothetical protein
VDLRKTSRQALYAYRAYRAYHAYQKLLLVNLAGATKVDTHWRQTAYSQPRHKALTQSRSQRCRAHGRDEPAPASRLAAQRLSAAARGPSRRGARADPPPRGGSARPPTRFPVRWPTRPYVRRPTGPPITRQPTRPPVTVRQSTRSSRTLRHCSASCLYAGTLSVPM